MNRPRCTSCHDRGGVYVETRTGRRWVRCRSCNPARARVRAQEAIREANTPPGTRFRTLADLVQLALPLNKPQPRGGRMARSTRSTSRTRTTSRKAAPKGTRRKAAASSKREPAPRKRTTTRRRREQEEYQEEPGWGSLFHRPDNEGNQPQYTGQGLNENGEPVELAIWVRKARSGAKYLRLHIQEPYEADAAEDDELDVDDEDLEDPDLEEDEEDEDEEDDIPF